MILKIILQAVLFCLTFTIVAQTIPNPGFENWTNFGGWYDNPNEWKTNNNQLFTPVVQDKNPHQGIYAVQVNQFGYVKSRFPFAVYPYNIQCFVKSNIMSDDSVSINVIAYFYNNAIDSGTWVNKTSIINWTPQTIFLTQSSDLIDSLEILINGGSKTGTFLSVDDLNFKSVGLEEIEIQNDWTLFPIPTSNRATLKFNNLKKDKCILILYNLNGEIVRIIDNITNDKVVIEKENLCSGLYFFQLQTDMRVIARGKMLLE